MNNSDPSTHGSHAEAPLNEMQSSAVADSQYALKKASVSKSDTASYLSTSGRCLGLLNTSSSPDVVLNPPSSSSTPTQPDDNSLNSEILDELGPLKNDFLKRKESWTSPGGRWWKGCRKSMDKGDYWPGCQPNDLPQGLREGMGGGMDSNDLSHSISKSCDQNGGHQKAVADMLQSYLKRTKCLFAQMPLGYGDKDEHKIPDAPQDLPLEIWTGATCGNSTCTETNQPKNVHYTITLNRVRFRKQFLLRLLSRLNDEEKQAVVYVNRPASVERICNWLKCQGIDAHFLHEGLLMAHTHWTLSEFGLKKFKVLVMSDDHFDFRSLVNPFGGIGLIVHYELPRIRCLESWMLRNKVGINASLSFQDPVEIITFFRSDCACDSEFKKLVENNAKAN